MTKRLYRSQTDKVVAGVCGGLGEYFEIDPVLVRIIAVIAFFATGFGAMVLAYIVGWIVVPKREEADRPAREYHYSSWHKYLPGLILIGIGAVLLMREFWYWFDFGDIWPMLLILAGLGLILIKGTRRNNDPVHSSENQAVGNEHVNNGKNGGGC